MQNLHVIMDRCEVGADFLLCNLKLNQSVAQLNSCNSLHVNYSLPKSQQVPTFRVSVITYVYRVFHKQLEKFMILNTLPGYKYSARKRHFFHIVCTCSWYRPKCGIIGFF